MTPIPPPSLSGASLRAFHAIFRHPAAHNLEWREVRALLEKLGSVTEEPNGNLRATRHGQILVLHPPSAKDVAGMDELMALRHFIERSQEPPPPVAEGARWLLVIDHREARVFRSDLRDTPPVRIVPQTPGDALRHAHHRPDFTHGKEAPAPNLYFEPVARALEAPGPILVFGSGAGMACEMEQFIAWANLRQPELARRIIGALVVDTHHETDAGLLARAREFHAEVAAARA